MDERRRAEEAFAQERDCVIVATSTLELGIDVGDLDRVIQIDAPRSVAAFLQRVGRTGRRPGTTRNCLFLALDGDGLLQAAGLLHLWAQGWVEEVVPPPEPRHIVAVFTAPPQFTVLSGRTEIGRTDPALLTAKVQGPRLLLLGGRSWRVTHIDWKCHRCFVEPAESGGKALWMTGGMPQGRSYRMVRAMRDVLLGADPPVALTGRAANRLAGLREEFASLVHPGGTLLTQDRDGEVRWWTWAGFRANATLISTLSELADPTQRYDDASIRLRPDLSREMLRAGLADAAGRLCLPEINDKALDGLKFSAALPPSARRRAPRHPTRGPTGG